METLDLGVRKTKKAIDAKKNNDTNSSSSSSGGDVKEESVGDKRKLNDLTDNQEADDNVKEEEEQTESGEDRVDTSTDGIKYSDLTAEQQKLRDHQRMLNRPKAYFGESEWRKVARPIGTMKGHTAFLTFAMAPLHK